MNLCSDFSALYSMTHLRIQTLGTFLRFIYVMRFVDSFEMMKALLSFAQALCLQSCHKNVTRSKQI